MSSAEQKQQEPNPNGNDNNNLNSESEHVETQQEQAPRQSSTRTPFTNLSQVDADLALARTLQEQERAYMMLTMNNDGSDYGSWETGSYLHEDDDDFGDPHDHDITDGGNDDEDEDDDDDNDGDGVDDEQEDEDEDEGEYDGTDADEDEDAHGEDGEEEDNNSSVELDPANFSSDEAYARALQDAEDRGALQDAEDREMATRLLALAGISDRGVFTLEDHGGHSQDAWEELDPDQLSYEELLALGDVVGTESRGLSADSLSSLPSITYKAGSSQSGSNDSCVICRVDYDDGDSLTSLSCKHSYHPECINNWLKINKVCPVCSAEVSTSGQS